MIKVLIVDDEVLVRIGIKSCIKWENSGFEIVGEAENGIEALELAERCRPDLVLTDIRMPKMDGLEFLKQLKESQPEVKAIILSCYNEFSYVREAMKLGALDYILKLSMQPDELLDILNKVKDVIDKEKQQHNEVHLLRQKVHTNLKTVKENYIKNVIAGNIKNDGEFIPNTQEIDLRIDFSSYIVFHVRIEDYKLIASTRWNNDEQSLSSSVITVMNNILLKYGESEVVQYEDGNIFVILSPLDDAEPEDTSGAIRQSAESIVEMVKTYLNLKVSLGISTPGKTADELNRKVREAQFAGSYGFCLKEESISFYNGDIPKEEIIRIKNHVKANYASKLSISVCARICNMSEKYFSYVFKKETGENFTDFVNRVRIEKAKELIKNHNMVIFEVANKVGYENDKYFIKLFRKLVGMTPGEYKRKYYTSF